VALGLTLPCFTLLGMLDRAMTSTRSYVLERRQFGQPLASFQGVQFQLTDAEVERAGAEELGKYALWSIEAGHEDAVADALAFRLATLEAADVVFRTGHQLHGAIGFCDETVLSWVSRYSAPVRRAPFGVSGTNVALTRQLGGRALTGLFGGEATA
jgi:alkylation response protein AidB-like acyl-CoA dehydrogenase